MSNKIVLSMVKGRIFVTDYAIFKVRLCME